MASFWQWLAFYLGFKKKQKDIERERKEQAAFADEHRQAGDDAIPPGGEFTLSYDFNQQGILLLDIESLNGSTIEFAVVDDRNLARIQEQQPYEAAIQAQTSDREQARVEVPPGNCHVIIANKEQDRRAPVYIEAVGQPP